MEKYIASDKNPVLDHEKERFKILSEMVTELLATENATDFLETVNFSMVKVIAEKTRKRGESEDTRYSRIEGEVEKRVAQLS